MKNLTIVQISVFLPDKPGILAKFIELLMENKIFIEALTVAHTGDYGLLLLLVDKPMKCMELLDENEHIASTTDVIGINFSEHPNALYDIPKTLGDNEVNIEYLYSTLIKDKSIIVLRVDDTEKAETVLKNNGFLLLDSSES